MSKTIRNKVTREQSSIEEKFRKIDERFDQISLKYKDELENAKIKPIHEKYAWAQNGITAFISGMGAGKSYNCLKLIARQEVLFNDPLYETVALCSTSGKFDTTVKLFKELIVDSNLIAIEDTELLKWLEEYTGKVLLYNTLMRFVNNDLQNPDEDMQKIITDNNLYQNKKLIEFVSKKLKEIGWETYPHRLLLVCDDFASHPLLKRKEDPLSRMFKKLRHFNINVIIIVQTVKDIPKNLKRNLSDCVIFPGISKIDFYYLINESSLSCFDADEVWSEYIKISNPQAMFSMHIAARKIVIKFPTM